MGIHFGKGMCYKYRALPRKELPMVDAGAHIRVAMAPYKILIVDDMATNRLVARSVLTHEGYLVEEAGSGQEAQKKSGSLS